MTLYSPSGEYWPELDVVAEGGVGVIIGMAIANPLDGRARRRDSK